MIGPKHADIIFVVYYVMVFILGCNQAEYHRGRGTHWTISKDFSSNNLTLSWFGIYKCEGLGPHLRAFVYNAVIFLIKDVYLKYANLIHKKNSRQFQEVGSQNSTNYVSRTWMLQND